MESLKILVKIIGQDFNPNTSIEDYDQDFNSRELSQLNSMLTDAWIELGKDIEMYSSDYVISQERAKGCSL